MITINYIDTNKLTFSWMKDVNLVSSEALFQFRVTPAWVLVTIARTHCLQFSISAVSFFVTLQI